MEEKNFMFNGLYKIDGINPDSIEFSREENGIVGSYVFNNLTFLFVELKSNFNIYSNHLKFSIDFNKKINKDEKKFIRNSIIEQTKNIAGIDIDFEFHNENTEVEFSIESYIPYKDTIGNPENIISPIIETSLVAYTMIMSNFYDKG